MKILTIAVVLLASAHAWADETTTIKQDDGSVSTVTSDRDGHTVTRDFPSGESTVRSEGSGWSHDEIVTDEAGVGGRVCSVLEPACFKVQYPK